MFSNNNIEDRKNKKYIHIHSKIKQKKYITGECHTITPMLVYCIKQHRNITAVQTKFNESQRRICQVLRLYLFLVLQSPTYTQTK